MKLGTYTIYNYTVTVNDVEEIREMIIYYNLDGSEWTRERYYGQVRDGYDPA